MNQIVLKGYIRDISYSHKIGDVEYDKANIVVPRQPMKDDVLSLKFKKFSNKYKENDYVELIGNVRTYSRKLDNGKNKVDIYVFTYFDKPEEDTEDTNVFKVSGRICKIDELRVLDSGKSLIHFILANELSSNDNSTRLYSYIPCVAWGQSAKDIEMLGVNTVMNLTGRLQSREYKKKISEDGDFEIKVANEVYVSDFEVIDD